MHVTRPTSNACSISSFSIKTIYPNIEVNAIAYRKATSVCNLINLLHYCVWHCVDRYRQSRSYHWCSCNLALTQTCPPWTQRCLCLTNLKQPEKFSYKYFELGLAYISDKYYGCNHHIEHSRSDDPLRTATSFVAQDIHFTVCDCIRQRAGVYQPLHFSDEFARLSFVLFVEYTEAGLF
jgi:hypothetical protein